MHREMRALYLCFSRSDTPFRYFFSYSYSVSAVITFQSESSMIWPRRFLKFLFLRFQSDSMNFVNCEETISNQLLWRFHFQKAKKHLKISPVNVLPDFILRIRDENPFLTHFVFIFLGFAADQPFHHVQLWTQHHNIATIYILRRIHPQQWLKIRTCTRVCWEKWKTRRLAQCIQDIRHTIGHSTRPQRIKLNRSTRAGGICMVLQAAGWIWAIQACMQQWQIMRPEQIIHRFRIHCRTQRIC